MNEQQELYKQANAFIGNNLKQHPSTPIKEALDQFFQNHASWGNYLKERLHKEFLSCGPLEKLLNDPEVTDIMVNHHSQIWYKKNNQTLPWKTPFLSEQSYRNFVQKVCLESGIYFNLDQPYVDGAWKNFRVHIISEPLYSNSICLTLRRKKQNSWTFSELKEKQWAQEESIAFIRSLLKQKKSFLIIGATGSGKTSVLNACLNELPDNERIIVIEDTDEILLPNKISVKLLTRTQSDKNLKTFSQSDLIIQALRMNPSRIIVGEVRGAEAKDMLMAFATGHEGGLCSLHAHNAQQALIRLEMLTQLGAPQWNLKAIRQLIFLSIQYIIELSTDRKLKQIYKLASLEDFGFLLEKV
ncbi:MAG: CpaF family protein [Bdellovibrio sp.]|nr:MAG: CpaF family protein [Bdellovibrio sp.]